MKHSKSNLFEICFKTIAANLEWVTLYIAVVLSVSSWLLSYLLGLTVTYNDAMSHLNLSRLIVDNLQSGVSQIGGVWLPLNHLLSLTLIWNNWAWHSGFAGSFFSMMAYVISVMGIFYLVKELTDQKLASFVGSMTFALSLNILYLQSTPLTEPLFLVFFVLSALYLIKWIKEAKAVYLPIIGSLGLLQVLTRYDGWFVIGVEALIIMINQLWISQEKIKVAFGKLLLFILPAAFGIFLWLLWNLLIFNNPLFFILGPYSAHAQQAAIASRSVLITKGNVMVSLKAFSYAVIDNVGWLITISGLIGLMVYLLTADKLNFKQRLIILLTLFSPVIFNIFSLFLGFSILNLPQMNWNPTHELAGQWFNVRYGILALPTMAVLIGLLAGKKKILGFVLLAIVLIQVPLTYQGGLITVIDGTIGSSAFVNQDISSKLASLVNPNDKVLMSTSFFNAVAFSSGLNLDQFIHEGVSHVWPYAIVNPSKYAKWLVIANGDVGEPLYTSLVKNQNDAFLGQYKLVYEGQHANIYQLRETGEIFVKKNGDKLVVGDNEFQVSGVNSYNLAYMSQTDIDKSFDLLESSGVNTVRFWLFGDGFDTGFQPKSGQFNENQFEMTDYIIVSAKAHNIRLIPTLINNWNDFGGKAQYLKWIGKNPISQEESFYTNSQVIALFENYVNKVITRYNKLNNLNYADDPTILAWDIMNEPRLSNGDPGVINQWITDIARYIKTIDPNHLVTIGTERVVSQPGTGMASNLCQSVYIDICSLHLYLYQNDQPLFNNLSDVENFINNQVQSATTDDKPLIIGEIGIPKNQSPYGLSAQMALSDITKFADSQKLSGYLIWNWSLINDDTFGFSPLGDSAGTYNISGLKNILLK